jgi:polyisoprenoid-binding protein YceI
MYAVLSGIFGLDFMTRARFLSAIAAITLAGLGPVRGAERYTFDQKGSKIGFEVHHLLGRARGQFHRFSGTIDLNRDAFEQSSVSVRIEVGSIDTGIEKRDDHLKSEDFFNAAKYPEITFKSRSVKRTGDTAGDVTGDFTMHGVTRTIVLHVELLGSASGEHTRWKVTTPPLNRRDFNLMFGSTAEAVSGISQEVAATIQIEATRSR